MEDNEDMRMCIRAFDESMCSKLNKQKLIDLKMHVEKMFLKKTDLDETMS